MKNIPSVSVKSTKDKILEALSIAKQNLAELEAQVYNPQHDKSEKQLRETLNKANSLSTSSLEEKVNDLQANVIAVLSSLISGIKNEKLEYDNLNAAIEAKKAELKDLYGIEDELGKFAIIVNAKQATMKELEEKISELSNLKDEKQSELYTMEKEWESEQKKIRDREKQDYDYEFSRQKKEALDKLSDELETKKKLFNEELEAEQKSFDQVKEEQDKRENELKSKEQRFLELETLVKEFPEKLEQAKKDAADSAQKDAAKVQAIKDSYTKKEAESSISVLQSKVNMLESALAEEKVRVSDLQSKLDDAYDKIRSTAEKAVDGANAMKYAEKITSNLNSSGNSK